MTRALAAAVLVLASLARAATPDFVRRRDMYLRVFVTGSVVAHGKFRLKSTIEGRVETVAASTGTWHAPTEALAELANTELAALLDARGPQDKGVLLDRWGQVYRPTPIRCPDECYVLKSYVRPKGWVRPQAVLFEAARRLVLVVRVRAEDAAALRAPGLTLTFWDDAHPQRKRHAPVTALIPDAPGRSSASFEVEFSPDFYLPPGTAISGVIVARVDHDALTVPDEALIRVGSRAYLPMLVRTGLSADGATEILAGAEDGRPILILDDAKFKSGGAAPPESGAAMIDSSSAEDSAPGETPATPPAAAAPAPATPTPVTPTAPTRPPAPTHDFGDDPYAR